MVITNSTWSSASAEVLDDHDADIVAAVVHEQVRYLCHMDAGVTQVLYKIQDYRLKWRSADHRPYLTCWCPLDDATVENGTVRLLPFSAVPQSRAGILPHERQPKTNDLVGWSDDTGAVTIEAPAAGGWVSRAARPELRVPRGAAAGCAPRPFSAIDLESVFGDI